MVCPFENALEDKIVTEPPVDAGISEKSDIVFECTACTKSLAIDRRGAGLIVTCPDCGQKVQVPGPAMKNAGHATQILEPLDVTEDRVAELEESLSASQTKVQELVEALNRYTDITASFEGRIA